MRTSKRALAGVAAGALGLALVPFVSVTAAQAAEVAGSNTPIRYTGAGNAQESSVPAGAIYWAKADANVFSGTPKFYFDGTTAPGGKLYLYDNLNTQTWAAGLSALDDTTLISLDGVLSADDSALFLKADTAGRYTGRIGNGTDTVAFDFTTSGAPASLSLTPATQSVLVGGTGELTAVLLDANGNATQPSFSSALAITQTGAGGTLAPSSVSAAAQATADDTAFALGSVDITDSVMASGTTTVTATGSGDLLGKSASATITTSGAISDDTVVNMAITSPTSGVWNKPDQTTDWVAQIKSGTSALTVTIDDTDVNTSGSPVRFKIETLYGGVTSGGQTAATSAPVYVDYTPTGGVATMDLSLAGAAAVAGNVITLTQVNVANAAIDGTTKMTITVVVPDITEAGVTVTPSGQTTTKLGNTTNVVVSVDDSLGDPAAGQVVSAYRTSVGLANLLSTATTGSDGSATVTVTNASSLTAGNSETYKFTVSGVGASAIAEDLTVNYTATGNIDTMSVTPHSASAFDAAGSLTVSTYSWITVPSTSGLIGTTMSTGTYNPTTEATGGTQTSVVDFRVATSPDNAFTVTVPEGVKVSTTAPTATTLYSAGSTTLQASYDDSVYMWATAVGTHEYTVESGGLTATGTLVVTNSSNDAYNVGVSPDSQTVGRGSINTVVVTVQDMFGNPVQAAGTTSGDDTGAVTVTASGEVLLGGFISSNSFATDENGQATITYIAGNSSGSGTLTVTPKASNPAPAWQTTYVAPAGKDAPRTSAASAITVTGDASKSITIVGQRGTVKGKPGVMVDGLTTGFAEGDVVVPWIKFPGQTSYSAGTSRPAIDADGEFYWQRKTGKKIYILFKNEDGTVKSDRIIIQAK